jgi:hypothetical protein
MRDRIMPRDVTTRWNSTYDMLKFALEYQEAIDVLTADRLNDLRMYEMSETEWTIARQLCDILAVSHSVTIHGSLCHRQLGSQGRNSILLSWYTQPRHCYSCHGLHQ